MVAVSVFMCFHFLLLRSAELCVCAHAHMCVCVRREVSGKAGGQGVQDESALFKALSRGQTQKWRV